MNQKSQREYLTEVKQTDLHFRYVGVGTVAVWLSLIGVSYACAPSNNFETLEGPEFFAALFSACFLGFSLFARFFQIFWLEAKENNNAKLSGVLWASFAVQFVAMFTNTLMCCGIPIPVMLDPVMGTRVFLPRWAEWVSLLMTSNLDFLYNFPLIAVRYYFHQCRRP